MKKLIIIAITIATVAGLVYAQTVRWRIQEIDGTVLATINESGDLILAGGVDMNEDVSVTLDAQDEEFEITTSSGSESARGVLRIINSDTTVTDQHYLLELWQYDFDASADADFIVATSSGTHATKVDKFTVSNDGSIFTAGDIDIDGNNLDLGDANIDYNNYSVQIDTKVNITATGTALDVDGDVNVDGTLLVDGVISAGTLPIALTDADGYLISNYESTAATTTVTISSGTLILITGTGIALVTMPDAATCVGRIWTIKSTGNLSGSTVTVNGGGDTIDGSSTHTGMDAQYDFITIQSDGTNYHIISEASGM